MKTLTPNLEPDRPRETRKLPRRAIAKITLAASLTCGAIVGTGISSPAQTSQPDSKQPQTPPTKAFQIDRRRIGPVILAASGPTGQSLIALQEWNSTRFANRRQGGYLLCCSSVHSATAQRSRANK